MCFLWSTMSMWHCTWSYCVCCMCVMITHTVEFPAILELNFPRFYVNDQTRAELSFIPWTFPRRFYYTFVLRKTSSLCWYKSFPKVISLSMLKSASKDKKFTKNDVRINREGPGEWDFHHDEGLKNIYLRKLSRCFRFLKKNCKHTVPFQKMSYFGL